VYSTWGLDGKGQAIEEGLFTLTYGGAANREWFERRQRDATAVEFGVHDERAGHIAARDHARFHHGLGPGQRQTEQRDSCKFGAGTLGRESLALEGERQFLLHHAGNEFATVLGGDGEIKFTQLSGFFRAATVERRVHLQRADGGKLGPEFSRLERVPSRVPATLAAPLSTL